MRYHIKLEQCEFVGISSVVGTVGVCRDIISSARS